MLTIRNSLSIIPGTIPVVVDISQYDKGLTELVFDMHKQSSAFDCTGLSVTCEGKSKDGAFFRTSGTVNGSTVRVTLTEEMSAIQGRAKCKLIFTDEEGQRVASAKFYLDTEEVAEGEVTPADIPLAQKLLEENNKLNARFDVAIAGATQDNEVKDVRLGADGKTYATAGTSVRAQFRNKVDKPLISDNDRFPRAKDGNVEWVEFGTPTDEQTEMAVSNWLDDHPEATTTVQDFSLTLNKFKKGELPYITPEMFGAVGDGETDDTEAINSIPTNTLVLFTKTYKVSDNVKLPNVLHFTKQAKIIGDNITLQDASLNWENVNVEVSTRFKLVNCSGKIGTVVSNAIGEGARCAFDLYSQNHDLTIGSITATLISEDTSAGVAVQIRDFQNNVTDNIYVGNLYAKSNTKDESIAIWGNGGTVQNVKINNLTVVGNSLQQFSTTVGGEGITKNVIINNYYIEDYSASYVVGFSGSAIGTLDNCKLVSGSLKITGNRTKGISPHIDINNSTIELIDCDKLGVPGNKKNANLINCNIKTNRQTAFPSCNIIGTTIEVTDMTYDRISGNPPFGHSNANDTILVKDCLLKGLKAKSAGYLIQTGNYVFVNVNAEENTGGKMTSGSNTFIKCVLSGGIGSNGTFIDCVRVKYDGTGGYERIENTL